MKGRVDKTTLPFFIHTTHLITKEKTAHSEQKLPIKFKGVRKHYHHKFL